jgi:hypothetical protein
MDEDLDTLGRDQLLAEVKRLRAGIREHRDSTGHDLCWHHPQLWVGLAAGADRGRSCGAAMAEVLARLSALPRIAGA